MPATIPIDDPDDPRLEPYRDMRERDLVGRQGLFVAEGKVVLEKLVASKHARPESVLVAAKRLAGLDHVVSQLSADVPVYSVPPAVLEKVAGFNVHRGILAIGRRSPAMQADGLLAGLPERAIILMLSSIANHDNMGGIFRNAAAFGADAILLDAECCDPLYRKAIRVSVGASLLTPWARLPRGTDPIAILRDHGFEALALSPSGLRCLAEMEAPPRAAVLLGAEGPGLDPDLIRRATAVRIPMADDFDSLNVATASGIVLHHLRHVRPARS